MYSAAYAWQILDLKLSVQGFIRVMIRVVYIQSKKKICLFVNFSHHFIIEDCIDCSFLL